MSEPTCGNCDEPNTPLGQKCRRCGFTTETAPSPSRCPECGGTADEPELVSHWGWTDQILCPHPFHSSVSPPENLPAQSGFGPDVESHTFTGSPPGPMPKPREWTLGPDELSDNGRDGIVQGPPLAAGEFVTVREVLPTPPEEGIDPDLFGTVCFERDEAQAELRKYKARAESYEKTRPSLVSRETIRDLKAELEQMRAWKDAATEGMHANGRDCNELEADLSQLREAHRELYEGTRTLVARLSHASMLRLPPGVEAALRRAEEAQARAREALGDRP